MNNHLDEDQDSLFGSPPPSPVKGRSPSQDTFAAGCQVHPTIAVPSPARGSKNVGTIALPGSHMSCAELPANPPASSLPLPRRASSHDSSSGAPPTTAAISTHPLAMTSRSSTHSVPSRASSAASTVPPTSRKRRTAKSKSSTSASPAPPITLPGPNEPTPPNFLRSQSSLLGLAGLVGSVKPAQLYAHGPQPTHTPQSRSQSPTRGSTPTHPIVLDDDQDTPRIGKQSYSQLQMPQNLDQLDPETLRLNIMSSLTKEKNIFTVLESLVKLLGGEPHLPTPTSPSQPFMRPYGHSIFNAHSSSSVLALPSPVISATPAVPPPKRRKLKHVPAGAADWDVPFPFAAGEGPKSYRDTWARDRAKQLVTQLLDLVQNAAKRAAVKTAKNSKRASTGRASSAQSSRSVSVETQVEKTDSSSITNTNSQTIMHGKSGEGLGRHSGLLGIRGTAGSPASVDRTSVDSESTAEENGSAVSYDYSAFEEWLSQLQQFMPFETNSPTLESDWDSHPSAPLDSAPTQPLHVHAAAPRHTPDGVIDPTLLAISQQSAPAPQSRSLTSPTSTIVPDGMSRALDIPPTPPTFAHSPRTSLSSLTEPLTPLSEVFGDASASAIARQDSISDLVPYHPVEKDVLFPVRGMPAPPSPTDSSEPPRIPAIQKAKGRGDGASTLSSVPSMSRRSIPNEGSISKGTLDKQAILERARERRKQLIAEIEQTKVEIWETTVENAVLVHFIRDVSS